MNTLVELDRAVRKTKQELQDYYILKWLMENTVKIERPEVMCEQLPLSDNLIEIPGSFKD